jgi:uncharacterized repeat protein (TIGR01451 family)
MDTVFFKYKNINLLLKGHFVICGFFLLMAQNVSAMPSPGSQITNIASGDFVDAQGNLQVVNSNPVSLTIQKVFALNLIQNQQQVATLGGKVDFPHTLSNAGNAPDTYSLSLTQESADNFDLSQVAVYADRNQDGLPDDNVNLLGGSTIQLDAGQSIALVVVGSIPSTVSTGNQANFDLKATSGQSSTLTSSVHDVVTVVDDAVINVTKSQSISSGPLGSEITYTFTYSNTGTAARRMLLDDELDTSLQYEANSAVWSNGAGNLTDADDGVESGANAGVKYKTLNSNQQVEFEVVSVAPLSTGSISFKVKVQTSASDKILNTGTYTQFSQTNSPTKTTSSNTVIFTPQRTLGVVLNNTSSSATNNGNPSSAPDNLISVTGAFAGQEVIFDNYVWNTGQAADTYNLSYIASNLPACATVHFYAADGRTLLADSSGDGIVDTGPIAPNTSVHLKVGVVTKPSCMTTSVIDLDVLAKSVTDSTVSDATRDEINKVVSAGSSDLYNSDNSGLTVGNVDNGGAPWLSKPIATGQKVVFPLVIKNNGTTPNNYNLYASGSVIDLSNITAQTLPTGWSVLFYQGDATCANVSSQITNTGNVPAGTTTQYCAVVSAPAGATVGNQPLWFAMLSSIDAQGDVVKDQVVVQATRHLILTNDQQNQVQAGGTVIYLHTLKNQGTVVEGSAVGKMLLTLAPQNAQDGFSYTLYYDANNNGELDATDPQVSDLNVATGGVGLAVNASIQLLVKAQAPSSATNGVVSQVDLVATPVGTEQGLTANLLKNTDVTTVNPNQLRLVKTQAIDQTCAVTGGSYAAQTYATTGVQVKPNQCVIYRLSVTNAGSIAANNVMIQDVVPVYTSLNGTPNITQGTVQPVVSGQIKGLVGTLTPLQQESLFFSIRVNP